MTCKPFPHLVAAIWAMLLSLAPAAQADTWILANGDRLNGTLVRESEEEIEIEHAALGKIVIARASLQGEVKDVSAAPAPVAAPAAQSTPPVTAKAPPAKASSETPSSRTAPKLKWMTRQIEFGYARQDGVRNKEDLSTRLQMEARLGSNSFRATGRVIRSETDDRVTVNRQEADFRWRRDFSSKLFAQSLTTYAADEIRKIDLSLEQQIGGGYRIIEARRHQVNVGLGAVLQRLAREGYDDYTTLLGSAFQDYALQWNERLRFTQEATVLVSEDGSMAIHGGRSTLAGAPADGNYRVKFNAALQTKMTDKVSLLVRYEYDYDRSMPEHALRTDSRLTTSLGYAW